MREWEQFMEKQEVAVNPHLDEEFQQVPEELDAPYTVPDDIDINDYTVADEEEEFGQYTDIMNVFLCHYKQLFCKNENCTMFDDIDYESDKSTNRGMEFVYDEIVKFNYSKEHDKNTLFNPDTDDINIEDCDELYLLYLDNEPVYVSKYIFVLVRYVAEMDWSNIMWSIIKIKG